MAVQKSKKSASKKPIKLNYIKFKLKNKKFSNNSNKKNLFKLNISKKVSFINLLD